MDIDADRIVEEALRLGASAAGVVRADRLRSSPSFAATGIPLRFSGGSILVLALAHPADDPGLDAWDGAGGTRGNRALGEIAERIAAAARGTGGGEAAVLPYHPSRGGVFVKDAAVLAGLGVIGRNNLLVTPRWGPRVRLRAAWLDAPLDGPGPRAFDPCRACGGDCAARCPEDALAGGTYARARCRARMEKDEAAGEKRPDGVVHVRYCRACETACPVGTPRAGASAWEDGP